MYAPASVAPTQSKLGEIRSLSIFSALGIGTLAWLVFSYGYIEDDAFIHLEFARSLSEGRGFSFNGLVVNGDTAPLWVMLLATVHSSGLGWIVSAKLLGGVGVIIALSGVWRVASDISGSTKRAQSLPILAVLLTALNPYFVHWSFSGMESVSALGVSLWALWAVFSAATPSWSRLAIGALLLSIAPLLRPELLLLSGVAGCALLYKAWRMPGVQSQRMLFMVFFAILMALPTVLWSAYAFEALGSIMPSTNAAKRGGALLPVAEKLASVYLVGFAGTIALLPFVAKRLRGPGVPALVWTLLLWPTACVVFYLVDHTAVQTRYCLLSMPSLTIAVLWLLEESAPAAWLRGATAAMAALCLLVVAAIVYPHVSNKVKLVKSVSTAAAYIRDNVPPDAPIAAGNHPLGRGSRCSLLYRRRFSGSRRRPCLQLPHAVRGLESSAFRL
jgi:hypothetical protein